MRVEVVPLGAHPRHRQQRCGLGESVDLDELPAQLLAYALDRAGRRGSAGDDDAYAVASRDLALPGLGAVECRRDDGRCGAQVGDAVLLDALEDLGAVDLTQHDVGRAHRGRGERMAPAVGVEHRQRVEVDVAVRHRGLPAEHRRVEPVVAMGQLHALGPRRGAGRVVDRRGRALVACPRLGLVGRAPDLVVVLAEHERPLALDLVDQVAQVGVDHQHLGAGVLDDVADLGDGEPEVDRHQHAAPARRRRRTTSACAPSSATRSRPVRRPAHPSRRATPPARGLDARAPRT